MDRQDQNCSKTFGFEPFKKKKSNGVWNVLRFDFLDTSNDID